MKFFTLLLALMTLATQQLGKPYSYATEGPSTFDCSGFVIYCYKEILDIDLPRSAKDVGYIEGYEIIENIDNLKAGDIICFNTLRDNDLSDHVGIYMGGRAFIHCSSGKGKVVISSLDEGYYNKNFSWGIRIFDFY